MRALNDNHLMIAVLGWTVAVAPAIAQNTTAAVPHTTEPAPVQITPFVSIDSRGSAPRGAAFSFPLSSIFRIETEVGYRRGEGNLNALSSSANLLYDLPRIGRVTPYLATGAGLAQYGAPIVARGGPVTAIRCTGSAGAPDAVDDPGPVVAAVPFLDRAPVMPETSHG